MTSNKIINFVFYSNEILAERISNQNGMLFIKKKKKIPSVTELSLKTLLQTYLKVFEISLFVTCHSNEILVYKILVVII